MAISLGILTQHFQTNPDLVGGLEHFFIFHDIWIYIYIWNVIIPTGELIFFRQTHLEILQKKHPGPLNGR